MGIRFAIHPVTVGWRLICKKLLSIPMAAHTLMILTEPTTNFIHVLKIQMTAVRVWIKTATDLTAAEIIPNPAIPAAMQ